MNQATSKLSKPMMNRIVATDRIAGHMFGSVVYRKVCSPVAPDTAEASSKVGLSAASVV